MNPDLAVAVVIGIIAISVIFLRTNVALAILGLCAGYVLSDLLASDVINFVYDRGLDDSGYPVAAIVSITLSLLPAALILYRFRNLQKGRFVQHIVPAIAFALLATLFVFTNLPLDADRYLQDQSYVYAQFKHYEVLITAVVVGIAIFDVLMHEAERKRKYKKHAKWWHRGKED